MRLIAFAGLALLVVAIGAAVVIPGRRTQADARSILIAAAQAAEEANSVYAVVTGAKSAKETSTGVALQPFRVETWAGPRGLYGRNSAADGKLTMALSLDADTGKLWFYDGDKKVLYVAGLASLEPKIGEFIPRISRQFSEVTVAQVKSFATGKVPRDAKETVAFETRGGHKVAIVVISSTGTLSTSRKSAVGRWIFEVDTDTHRLLNVHRYVRVQGQPEQLVEAIEDIQYDVPIPAGLANLQPPEGAKTAKAFVSFEKTKSVLSLVLKADGKEIMRSSVPLALGNEHPR